MQVLVLTHIDLHEEVTDKQGVDRRLQLFLDALGGLGARFTMAHLVQPELAAAAPDPARLALSQARYWGQEVTAVTLLPRGRPSPPTAWNYYGAGILQAADQPQLRSFAGPDQAAALARLLDTTPHDLVFAHRLPGMCALLRSGRRPPRVFFDLDDLEHVVRLRTTLRPPLWPGKLATLAQLPALLAAELRGAALARLSFVCSAADAAHMGRFPGGGRFVAVPNAVAVPPAPPPLPAAPTILFLGACDYPPNMVAAERLATRVLPRIRARLPAARALIAGRGSERLPSAANPPDGAEYLGFVPDLDTLYARARIVCAPIETGGGTRVKLVEAAGYGRPMVSTRLGAEGLDFAAGSEILLADDDTGLAEGCLRLLQDDTAAQALGEAARTRMRATYDAAAISRWLGGLMGAEMMAPPSAAASVRSPPGTGPL
jgi:hypothetical protein